MNSHEAKKYVEKMVKVSDRCEKRGKELLVRAARIKANIESILKEVIKAKETKE
jgi:hypothetical protein